MPAAWDDENATEPTWSDTEAWRGEVHLAEEDPWTPELPTLWAPAPELPVFEEELLDDEDWCPGGWLDDWGDDEAGENDG